ncbi:Hypothetical predicted protein [Cloeon dipterum]|uniref:Gustatory receptor n=1 Tax=Cloeon dipterum TaxID=197152 RepID=A0A8S1DJK6_9INSE|nr:Hypothetical predicted protein [Cloeon dipterum]
MSGNTPCLLFALAFIFGLHFPSVRTRVKRFLYATYTFALFTFVFLIGSVELFELIEFYVSGHSDIVNVKNRMFFAIPATFQIFSTAFVLLTFFWSLRNSEEYFKLYTILLKQDFDAKAKGVATALINKVLFFCIVAIFFSNFYGMDVEKIQTFVIFVLFLDYPFVLLTGLILRCKFLFLLLIVKQLVININKRLAKSSAFRLAAIAKLRKTHSNLWILACRAFRLFRPVLFLHFHAECCHSILCIYQLIIVIADLDEFKQNEELLVIGIALPRIVFNSVSMQFLFSTCETTVAQLKMTKEFLSRIETSDLDLKEEIEIFRRQVLHSGIEDFSFYGLLTVNRTLFLAVVGMVLAYSTMVVQFHLIAGA